ncbi:interleukin-1 receptor type 2-like [Neopelma chrysocephalum]|uniref:interleukin-1 receptor type 2-like n=1 Tax=Neopelma chrysocephalum TaxID=114329 RepID=UPI000FCD29FC|nr:interleukin-1 receptor type 2-like [Neopelma chrysocephalum]XP_027530757.1 interleukin-1 receptor type 2-like [Neopelma chrysocephalum]
MRGLFFVLVTCTAGASAFRFQQVKNMENCPDHTVFFKHYYELHGEPVVLKCPSPSYKHLDFSALTPNITWYKNGSKTMISGRDEDPRIWAKENALWFLPVMLEDSGVYICTKRNSSYCVEVSIHLTVVEKTAAQEIAYPQVLFTFTSGKIVCPDLWDFSPNWTSLELKWYKDTLPLEDNNEKFVILKGSASLIMTSVLPTDAGYYTCKMLFPFEGVMYEITRTIQLETAEREKRITPIIVYPTQKTTSAVLGSKMTLPCKVFVGLSSHVQTDVEWLANDTSVDVVYKQSRVTEGERQEIVENDENFIEVPLIFDSVEEMDFYTDFTCLAQNRYGYQVLPTRVKQEAVGLSWYIAMIPIALACVIVGGICMHKCWKRRDDKRYSIAKV